MQIKTGISIHDLTQLHPSLSAVRAYIELFCFNNQLPFTITSLIRNGDNGPHGCGRGLDFRVNDWPKQMVSKLEHEIKRDLNYLGAYSRDDNKQRVIIFHGKGANFHGHCQVHP